MHAHVCSHWLTQHRIGAFNRANKNKLSLTTLRDVLADKFTKLQSTVQMEIEKPGMKGESLVFHEATFLFQLKQLLKNWTVGDLMKGKLNRSKHGTDGAANDGNHPDAAGKHANSDESDPFEGL